MNQQLDMAHVLGSMAKWAAIVIVFGFSLTLSISFFTSIEPPDKPWFPLMGIGLTEGGFILWMIVFMLTRHHSVHKSVALVMTCASAAASLMIAGYELYGLMAEHFDLTQNGQVTQLISIGLLIIFMGHFVAFIVDLFAGYFSRPGNNFRNGNLIPIQQGNLIPMQQSRYSIEELRSMQNAITGYLAAAEQDESDPLAGRQLPQPQSQDAANVAILEAAGAVKQGVSSLMKKAKSSIKSGKKAGRVPGQTNETTSESTSTEENSSEPAKQGI